MTISKPPYRIPSMAEIAAVEPNGYSIVSTFSGCGGSCLGFKMAGFKVAYAVEFVPAARETYAANHPGTVLDGRDIRQITPDSIRGVLGTDVGQLDVLEGSPPCASFSTAGKREKHWGDVKKYSDVEQRTDDLFFEYVRLLRGLKPKVFVAENVSGLVKGVAKGYFIEIIRALKASGYRVKARLLDAQWLGVPQARQRIIFVGVREDLGIEPRHPKPLEYRYSVRDALPWIGAITGRTGPRFARVESEVDRPMNSILVTDPDQTRYEITDDVEAETDISRFAIGKEWDEIGGYGQSKKFFQLVRPDVESPCPTITASEGSGSIASVVYPTEKRKFSIAELKRICGFPDDFALTGSYAQRWERLGRSVPPPMMRAVAEQVRAILDEARARSA